MSKNAATRENTTGKSPSRKSIKGEDRRKVILNSASRFFAQGGFNANSLAEIAADVGITQAGLLHHFPSKSKLLMAMLEQRAAMMLENEKKHAAKGQPYLDTFLDSLRETEKTPELVQLFTLLSTESVLETHPAHEWFLDRYRRLIAKVKRELNKLIDPEKLPENMSIEDVARSIIGLADGLRLQWLYEQDNVNRVKIMSQFLAMLEPYMWDDYLAARKATNTGMES